MDWAFHPNPPPPRRPQNRGLETWSKEDCTGDLLGKLHVTNETTETPASKGHCQLGVECTLSPGFLSVPTVSPPHQRPASQSKWDCYGKPSCLQENSALSSKALAIVRLGHPKFKTASLLYVIGKMMISLFPWVGITKMTTMFGTVICERHTCHKSQ